MQSATEARILDEVVCISVHTNALRKGMIPSLPPIIT